VDARPVADAEGEVLDDALLQVAAGLADEVAVLVKVQRLVDRRGQGIPAPCREVGVAGLREAPEAADVGRGGGPFSSVALGRARETVPIRLSRCCFHIV
jgi:hypothetical protein